MQQDGFRYSARDVAIKRGQLEHCPVVLGSATPSLESWHNADQSRYQRHHLSQRAGQGSLPLLRQVDISGLDLSAGLSNELIEKIDSTLSRGHQVLVFLNRRGFATAMVCHDCGWVSDCPDCDARMTLHKTQPGYIVTIATDAARYPGTALNVTAVDWRNWHRYPADRSFLE